MPMLNVGIESQVDLGGPLRTLVVVPYKRQDIRAIARIYADKVGDPHPKISSMQCEVSSPNGDSFTFVNPRFFNDSSRGYSFNQVTFVG